MKALYKDPKWREWRREIDSDKEHRKRLSLSLKGEKNGMFGKKHSQESCAKMSKSRSGEIVGESIWYAKKKRIKLKFLICSIWSYLSCDFDKAKISIKSN